MANRGLVLIVAAVLALAGCGDRQPGPRELVVGAGPGPESVLLAELYAAALRYYGTGARVESVPDPLTRLDTGEFAVVPSFTGRVLQRYQPGAAQVQDQTVYRAMVAALPEGIAAGDYATAAQDKPAAVVTEATATAWGGRELTALVRHCDELSVGSVAGVVPPAAARRLPDAPGARISQ